MNLHNEPEAIGVDGERFYFYRGHFPEGDFAGYRSYSEPARFRFWVKGLVLTGAELADYLTAQYEQASEDGIRAVVSGYSALRNLPA